MLLRVDGLRPGAPARRLAQVRTVWALQTYASFKGQDVAVRLLLRWLAPVEVPTHTATASALNPLLLLTNATMEPSQMP